MINIINLGKGQVLSKSEIKNFLNSSRSTYQYAKFKFHNGIYLAIVYNKDLTIMISTNSRNIALYNEMQSLQNCYTQCRAIQFMFKWVNKLTR